MCHVSVEAAVAPVAWNWIDELEYPRTVPTKPVTVPEAFQNEHCAKTLLAGKAPSWNVIVTVGFAENPEVPETKMTSPRMSFEPPMTELNATPAPQPPPNAKSPVASVVPPVCETRRTARMSRRGVTSPASTTSRLSAELAEFRSENEVAPGTRRAAAAPNVRFPVVTARSPVVATMPPVAAMPPAETDTAALDARPASVKRPSLLNHHFSDPWT